MIRKGALLLAICMMLVVALTGCGNPTANNATAQPTGSQSAEETPSGETAAVEETPAPETASTDATPAPTEQTAPTSFKQSPFLDGKELPAVADRLPKEPKLTNEMPADMLDYQVGTYGGTLRTVTSVIDWDADVFVACNEPLLNTPGIVGDEVTGNILKGYEASSDQKEFTFYLREGLKWSDGQPVVMDDFKFAIEDIIMNKDYTPIFPDWLRSGGVSTGNPMKFEVVDDWTFKIIFDQPYGGFPIRLAIKGWVGYTDLLKPSHYLKKYHKKYASEAEIDAACDKLKIEKNDTKYTALFNQVDITNWELNHADGIGFPSLYPWVLTKVNNNVYTYERNPYYFKVDTAGNQLPYIDSIQSTLVQDMEMVQMKVISGEVDFCRESASLINMPLYKENENKGITAYLCNMHVTPTDIFLNMTIGDDNYKKITNDVRFRKALSLAIDRDQVIDSIYYGYAEKGTIQDSTYDVEAAKALLDEIGMKVGTDGYRQGLDGKKFTLTIQHAAQAPDIQPYCQLLVNFWKEIGLDVKVQRIESKLLDQRIPANEVEASMIWMHTPLWYMQDHMLGWWGPLWNSYIATQGKEGVKPPEDVQKYIDLMNQILLVSPEEGKKLYDQSKQDLGTNYWALVPLENIKQPLVCNSKLGNVSDKGFAIATNFSAEQFFFQQ